jgi:SnoaL-like domain
MAGGKNNAVAGDRKAHLKRRAFTLVNKCRNTIGKSADSTIFTPLIMKLTKDTSNMHRSRLLSITLALAFAFGICALFITQHTFGKPKPMSQCNFETALNAHLKAIDTRDWDAFERTLTKADRLTLITPNGRYSDDTQTFKRQMKAWLADKDWNWRYEILGTSCIAETGIAVLRVGYDDLDEQGKNYNLNYLLSLTFVREQNEWRLVHDQNTMIPN